MIEERMGTSDHRPSFPRPFPKLMQDILKSINSVAERVQQVVLNQGRQGASSSIQDDLRSSKTATLTLEKQLEVWRKNTSWVDQPPSIQVSVPKGSLCCLESTFQLGIPPEAVFNILIDPENKRVFKSIKEITYRKVIEDEGDRQLVEVEQAAMWRFLWLSGTMSVRVFVDQNRRSHTVKYRLSKDGFMKRFDGTWEIKPLYVDRLAHASDEVDTGGRVASEIHLHQYVQPSLIPPPPIAWYVRGITTRTTESLIEDLQAEGKRIREGEIWQGIRENHGGESFNLNSDNPLAKRPKSSRHFRRITRRKEKKHGWRIRN